MKSALQTPVTNELASLSSVLFLFSYAMPTKIISLGFSLAGQLWGC